MLVARRADAYNGSKSCLRELRRKLPDRTFVEAAEHEGSIDRLHHGSEVLHIARRHVASDRGLAYCLGKPPGAQGLRLGPIHGIDLEHLVDRSYARDRFLRE